MYSRKAQEMDCPVLNIKVSLVILYEVSGTDRCQIQSDVVSASCSQEGECVEQFTEKCLINSKNLKNFVI